jgi:hypothetical protein
MKQLEEKIIGLYNEYKEFDAVVKEKNKEITQKKTSVKDIVKDKSTDEVKDVLLHIYVDAILYNKDLQIMFFRLVTNIETYLEFSKEPLNEEITNFYNEMKTWSPKKVFVLEKGELVETEVGVLDKARKDFLESDFFKGMLEQVTK